MKATLLIARALVIGPAKRHPLRVLLPALGVAIGVAAVAAIHHANRSVTESFRDAAASVAGRSDFVVTGVRGVPVAALEKLAFLWKVGAFAPAVTGPVVVDDAPGGIVDLLGVDLAGDSAVRDIRMAGGTDAAAAARVAMSHAVLVPETLARRHGWRPGSTVRLIAGGAQAKVTVGALLELSGVARASGGDMLITDVLTAQALLGRGAYVDRVDVVLRPGVDKNAVREELARLLPAGLSVDPPGRAAETADRMVRAFRFNLNALGSLTLLVGAFLIANAVSIAVLRRRPEIATLRALGVSRAAIFGVFLAEGLAIGAAGTAAGEFGGALLARAALAAVGGTVRNIYMPAASIAAADYRRAALLAAAVGMIMAVAATLLPAAEATRIEPSPAMRPGSIEGARRRSLAPRALAAAVALAAAAFCSQAGPIGGFPWPGFAAVGLLVVALSLVSPLLVAAAASAAAAPLARFAGAPGRLAARFFGGSLARNALAVTALAMALGMTLAMIVTVSSIRETVRVWVETTLRSDLFVRAAADRAGSIVGDLPSSVIAFAAGLPGVAAVDPVRVREAVDREGRPFAIVSGDYRVAWRIGGIPFKSSRDGAALAREAREKGEVFVSEPYSRRFSVGVGDSVSLDTPKGRRAFRVAAVYRDFSNDRGTVVLDRELYLSLFDDDRVTSLAVLAAPGTDATELRRRLLAEARGRFALSITTNSELRREVLRIFDRTFAVTRSLEGIAVAVSVLGIANALLASAVERRRSFGLLRAIGASRGQIGQATLLEALLSGVAGCAAAIFAGAGFAALLLLVLNPQSFGWTVVLHVPGAALAGAVALVLAASILAGLLPGRLAAAVDPAAALAEE
ncbi:MAG TPA: FtsX-like permease family protein [Thermoanaerobaculia bacterium]|nr:FtsX-like permease family protein [Thermoanaerobaculia bacterium]